MFQRDYLLRLIEQMTEAFAAVMGLRQQKKFEQAYEALDDLLHRLSLPRLQVLKTLAAPDVIELLTSRGVTETDKLLVVAKALREDAGIASDAGDEESAAASHTKAVRLYAEAVRISKAQRTELPDPEELEEMLSAAGRTGFPADVCVALAYAYEAYGRYDQAENRWFEALESASGDAGMYEQGVRFYDRLQRLDEERLKAGALPAEEVREGLLDFTRRFGPNASE